jgi:hypothetical protein
MGPSLVGLADPLHAAVISLMHLTFDFVVPWMQPQVEGDDALRAVDLTSRIKYIAELTDRIGEAALKCSRQVNAEFGNQASK